MVQQLKQRALAQQHRRFRFMS